MFSRASHKQKQQHTSNGNGNNSSMCTQKRPKNTRRVFTIFFYRCLLCVLTGFGIGVLCRCCFHCFKFNFVVWPVFGLRKWACVCAFRFEISRFLILPLKRAWTIWKRVKKIDLAFWKFIESLSQWIFGWHSTKLIWKEITFHLHLWHPYKANGNEYLNNNEFIELLRLE